MLYFITPSIFFRYLRHDIIVLSLSAWGVDGVWVWGAAFERDADGAARPDACSDAGVS